MKYMAGPRIPNCPNRWLFSPPLAFVAANEKADHRNVRI